MYSIIFKFDLHDETLQADIAFAAAVAYRLGYTEERFKQLIAEKKPDMTEFAVLKYQERVKKFLLQKKKVNPYERLGCIPVDEVIPLIGKKIEAFGKTITLKSKRYYCYLNYGVKCVRCGREGTYFAVEKFKNQESDKYHLNLYLNSYIENGEEIMMTVDHIHPLSKGGPDRVSNLQPMCQPCNGLKGNCLEGNKCLDEISVMG